MKPKTFLISLFITAGLLLSSAGDKIEFNPGQIYVGDSVNFTVNPPDSSSPFTYKWNFGDGTPRVTQPNPSHAFKEPGNYTVQCEKKHESNVTNITKNITVQDRREVKAKGANYKAGTPVEFEAKHFVENNIRWDFGDGPAQTGPKNSSHTFTSAGNYTVKVKDYGGNTSTEITCTVNVGADDREVTFSPANPIAGQEISFEAKHFSSSNLKWEFGDSSSNGGANIKHTYNNQGNYTVKVIDLSIGNSSFVEKNINISPDNRNISFAPQNPGLYEEVTFTAQNFSSSSIKWDFDKGEKKDSGGTVEKKTFKSLGQYQIKAKEAGTEMPFKKIVLNISQDKRKISISPPSGNVGAQVTIKLENSNAASVNWVIGNERKNNSPKQIQYQFKDPGSYSVKAEINDQSPLQKNININDNRKVIIKNRIAFAGSEINIESQNFNAQSVKWDFGDGQVKNGGKQEKHIFNRSGNFTIKVFDFNGESKKAVEARLNVRPDTRRISANYDILYSKADIEFSAANFGDSRIKWNFGDGTVRVGGRTMSHSFRSPGNFRVIAVDFGGSDSKKIEKSFRVENDRRALGAPSEILTGVPVDITLKNAMGGNFTWKFSDGKMASGNRLMSAKFDSPGERTVTIIDKSGKYPPFSKKLRIVPDTRSLKLGRDAALPGEKVKVSALNFKGVSVKWDFGDGTPPVVSSKIISHKFAKVGTYKVTVIDMKGEGKKLFQKNVKISEILPGFDVTTIELVFTNGKYYRVIPKSSTPPRYKARFKVKGRGLLHGKWLLDGDVFGQFNVLLFDNEVARLKSVDLPRLPVVDTGIHKLTFEFTNFKFGKTYPFLKYFVSTGAAIKIVSPFNGSKVYLRDKTVLKWKIKNTKQKFEIAISNIPFRFLEEKQINWVEVGNKFKYQPDLSGFKNDEWVYWMVRVLDSSGAMVNSSETASFKIISR